MREFEMYNRLQALKQPFFSDKKSDNFQKLMENIGSDFEEDDFEGEDDFGKIDDTELETVELDDVPAEGESVGDIDENGEVTEPEEEETEDSIISEMEETIEKFTDLVEKFKKLHKNYQE
jgi:hypothetical protein